MDVTLPYLKRSICYIIVGSFSYTYIEKRAQSLLRSNIFSNFGWRVAWQHVERAAWPPPESHTCTTRLQRIMIPHNSSETEVVTVASDASRQHERSAKKHSSAALSGGLTCVEGGIGSPRTIFSNENALENSAQEHPNGGGSGLEVSFCVKLNATGTVVWWTCTGGS